MWAIAQHGGRPVESRRRPLFNATKFSWRPLLECHAVSLPRRETHWNLQGCPKLANSSHLLVSQSSPYCEDMWGKHCCLPIFFPIVDTCLSCEDIVRQSCAMVPRIPQMVIFWVLHFQWASLPSNRHHRSNADCLEGKRENYQVCSVHYFRLWYSHICAEKGR